MLLKLNVT
jgi:hypothetical protein